jgi:hypothetical protein
LTLKHFGLTIGEVTYALASVALVFVIAYLWFVDTNLAKAEKFSGTTVMVSAWGIMFSFWQSERSRRKQFRIEFLTKSYQAIEEAFSRDFSQSFYKINQDTWNLALENAIRDLQLMGSSNVAGLARSYTLGWSPEDKEKIIEKILKTLRNELRGEIDEEYIHELPRSLRHKLLTPSNAQTEPSEPVKIA